jgi:hypothetical protein
MSWRKPPRKWLAVVGLVGLAGALSAVGISSAATTVTIKPSDGLDPSRLPKTKFKPASLNVVVQSNHPAGETPVGVTNTVLEFDDDGKITTKGLATCRRDLEGTTTEQAKQMCRSSIVGKGRARAFVTPTLTSKAVVTAFNGPKRGGNPTIILHARADLGITQVLTGTIRKINAGDFGFRLTVPVPPLPGGAILTRFETTVKRTWRHRGRQMSYISGRCHDGNKTLNIRGRFDMASGPDQSSAASQRCRVAR